MRFARWTFLVAGILGAPILASMYFLEDFLGRQLPPAINHPEIYYGFVGVTLAWQIGYVMIGLDPLRYRPLMLLAAFAKGSFAVAVVALVALGQTPPVMVGIVAPDAVFAVLFILAFALTGNKTPSESIRR
jgi:hypothetical protein